MLRGGPSSPLLGSATLIRQPLKPSHAQKPADPFVGTGDEFGLRGANNAHQGTGVVSKVLAGLIKRIDKKLETLGVFDPKSLDQALEVTHHA